MLWNFPVPIACYLIGALLAILLATPRLAEKMLASRFFFPSLAALFVAGIILAPARNHLLGDGLTLLGNIDRAFAPTEPLDLSLHYLLFKLTGSMSLSYHIVAYVAGLFYLWGIRLLMRLGATPLDKAIIALALLATATVQFYAAYVESYTLLNLFILYYLYFAWRDISSKKASYLPLLFFLLAVASHFSGIVLLPSLLYLYRNRLQRWVKYLLTLLVLGGIVVAFTTGISEVTVPLIADEFSAYSLFSGQHLADLLRELLLVSPAFLLIFLTRRNGKMVRFTLIALAGTLLFTMLIDPKIGAFRDWDLLSIFAVPLAVLIALRAPRHRLTVALLALIIVIRIVPWLLFNSSLQIEFTKQVVDRDIHYSKQYDNGWRFISWGVLLHQVGDLAGAEQAFLNRLKCYRDGIQALSLLVPTQFQLGKYRQGLRNAMRGIELAPDDEDFRYLAIYCAFCSNDLTKAQDLIATSPRQFRTYDRVRRLRAGILSALGKHQQAVEIARSVPVAAEEPHLPATLAHSFLAVGDYVESRKLIDRALEFAPGNSAYRAFSDSLRELDKR